MLQLVVLSFRCVCIIAKIAW